MYSSFPSLLLPFLFVFFGKTVTLVFLFTCPISLVLSVSRWRICLFLALSLKLGTLAPSYRWDSELLGWLSAVTVCFSFSLSFVISKISIHNNYFITTISIHNNYFTPVHNSPIAPPTALSFYYFPGATLHFCLS